MKINVQDYDQITVMEMHGEFTEENSKRFEEAAAEQLNKRTKGIVLDMSNISFIDSRGLEQMLWLKDSCYGNGCELRLAALDGNCQKILQITRLDREFETFDDLAESVKSIA